MKILLKTIFAPVIFILWIFIKIASVFTYVSGLVFGAISGIIAVISLVYLMTGSVSNAIAGFILAYLLSPYGIPLFVIMILGIVQSFKYKLQDGIYG
ncbi:MAG: succinate dehydrogenase [Clostridia bacterium]|nr:succinate dehydrogenase [Clostridia bacterium]